MLKRGVPVYYVLIVAFLSILAGGLLSFTLYQHAANNTGIPEREAVAENASVAGCDYDLPRLNGFKNIRPLLFAEQNCESEKYKPMKQQVAQLIEQLTDDGTITTASVYVRDFDESAWMCYNPDEKYNPASLMKIPILFSFLRLSEDYPGLLNQELNYEREIPLPKTIFFPSDTIQPGRRYTYRQLLQAMIIHSDNNATQLLMNNLQDVQFIKTFTDLGLEPPKRDSLTYNATVKDCSVFLKVLYDGSYLTIRNSDYATTLLTETDFKQGLVSGLPATIKVAHKFGEAGDGQIFQLHETAIVYLDKSPYLITVMTKGKDIMKLPKVLSSISALVYNNMARYN